jgi:hypothetical protein
MQLWKQGPVLHQMSGFTPAVASWDKRDHPSSIRLHKYLDEVSESISGHLLCREDMFLHLDVDVVRPEHLLVKHDLENYLTPLAARLGPKHFALVSATKGVGGGSQLKIGLANHADTNFETNWDHCTASPNGSTNKVGWKEQLRQCLVDAKYRQLPEGPVEVHLAFCCGLGRNWSLLWKPAGDAMGPVLGESKLFNPRDDRITKLTLHRTLDKKLVHDVMIAMWWRSVGKHTPL